MMSVIQVTLALGKLLLQSMKEGLIGNVIAMFLVSGLTAYGMTKYVDARHYAVLEKVGVNTASVKSLSSIQQESVTALTLLKVTLKNMGDTITEVKKDTIITKKRVWTILERQIERNK